MIPKSTFVKRLSILFLAYIFLINSNLNAQTPTPSDGVSGVSQSTTQVSWTNFDTDGVQGPYNVEFHDDAGFGNLLFSASDVTTASPNLTISGLLYNTTYYWRIADLDSPGDVTPGPWQNFSFTTEIATPVITSQSGSPMGESITPTVSWTLAGGTTGVTFDVQYSTDNFVADINTDASGSGLSGTTTSHTFTTSLMNNKNYKVRVVAKKAGESDKLSNTPDFTTVLATPVNATPGNTSSALYTSPVTFNWTHAGNYANVDFLITAGTDAAVTQNTVSTTVTGALTTTLAIPNAGTYYWKVQATVNDGGAANNTETTTSTITSFTQTLPTPTLTPLVGNQNLDVTLSWSAISGANQYTLEVNTNNTFTGTSIYNSTVGNIATKAPGNLSDNSTYYWRVTASNTVTGESSSTSAFSSFTTIPQTVVGIFPADTDTQIIINPTISWPATSGADKYRLQVNTDAGFAGTSIYDADVTGTSQAVTGLNNTTYYWRVTASSNLNSAITKPNGITSSSTSSFTTVLATPSQTSPANNSSQTFVDPVAFSWSMAASYSNVDFTVTVATDLALTQNVVTSTVSNLLATTISLPQAGDYYWKIDAVVTSGPNSGETKTSGTTKFTLTLPGPALTSPINGLTGVSVEPTLTWGSVVGAVSYKVYLDDANDFTTPLYSFDQGTNLTKSFFEIETEMINGGSIPLDNNTKYYWKVAAIDNIGTEFDSQIYHFTTYPEVSITQTLPIDASTINYTDVTFYWYIIGSQGSMQFKIQVKESLTSPTASEWATVGTNDFVSTTTSTNKLFTLLQGKKYYWRVIVLDASNKVINYSSTHSFNTSGGVTATAIQTWPVGGATLLTNTPTLYWYLDSYAPGVTFQVKYNASSGTIGGLADLLELNAGDKYPTDANIATTGSTDLFLTLPLLSSGTTYYWQVRVYYPATGLFGPWSGVESFIANGSGTLVKPVASYPTGNVTLYTTAPTLYWYTGTSGLGLTYNVDIELASAGLDGVADYTGISDLFKLVSGLTPGESYIWSVQSDNSVSQSTWSDPATFNITGGVGNGYPVITWPVGNPTVYTTKPTISWFIEGSQLGLTSVILRYKESSNSTNWNSDYDGTVTLPISTTSYTFTTDLTEGSTYYFALASTDGSTFSAWDEDAFTVYDSFTNMSDPILTSPIGGITLGTKSPTLYWYVIGNQTLIQSFEVTYSKSDVFAGGSPTTEVVTVTNPYLALSNLTPGATYYWRVRSLYTNASYSNYSNTETFVVDPGSNAIQPLIGGPNNVVVNTTAPTISWILRTEHSAEINSEIVIADNPDMVNAITIDNINDSRYDISDLQKGKSYFWKVRTKTKDNIYSEFSGQGVFKIGDNVTSVKNPSLVPDKFEVTQNYPNPFNPSTVIEYSIPNAEFVTVRIYNMLGQEIATLLNEEVTAGTYKLQWNGHDNYGNKVSTGSYIYRVVAGNNVATKKMILLK